MAENETILNCLKALFLDPQVDTIFSMVIPIETSIGTLGELSPERLRELETQYNDSIDLLNDLAQKYKKPIYFVGKVPFPEGEQPILTSQKIIPSYPSALRAARVVHHLTWYRSYLQDRGH